MTMRPATCAQPSLRGLGVAVLLIAAQASAAPPEAQVKQARQLYTQALADEDRGEYALALEKYRAVQSVRDTAPVRFRIALCTRQLGKLSDARALFLQTADGTQIPSAEDGSVRAASRDMAAELATLLAYVRIDGPLQSGDERLVRLDGQAWNGVGMREVDPGAHVLEIASESGTSREVRFTVGRRETHAVRLFEPTAPTTERGEVATSDGPSTAAAVRSPRATHAVTRWPGWAGLVGGGVLAGVGIAFVGARESEVGAAKDLCPGDVCRASRTELDSRRDRAGTFQLVAVTTLSVGVAALAFGGLWLLLHPHAPRQSPAAGLPWRRLVDAPPAAVWSF